VLIRRTAGAVTILVPACRRASAWMPAAGHCTFQAARVIPIG